MPLLPVVLQRTLVKRSKELLVASNRTQASRFLGLRAYDLMQSVIRRRFGSVDGVRAVYLCHSLAQGECYPGLSDFDLAVVFESSDPLVFYDRIRWAWGSLKRYFPISDLSILTVDEFDAWQTIGGGWDPLDEVRHWKLLAGDELRRDRLNVAGDAAALDRVQWALGHYQNLLSVAIKEEPPSPLMAIVARRQLHKCFWNAVLGLHPAYLAIPRQRARVEAWIREHGDPEPVRALEQMYADRFVSGPVTTTRFSAAALAARLLDQSLSTHPILARPLRRPTVRREAPAIANAAEVEERAQAVCASLLELLDEKLESVMLSSTGTARGYALYIILRDELSTKEIADALRDIRAIHRVFDDPWFNEHIPAGVPTVCTRTMFLARLQSGRSSLDYFETFRRVLYGRDLYAELTTTAVTADPAWRVDDWRREHLLYSVHLHQIYLARLKPALHDYVTFYLPRLMLQRQWGMAPVTAEDASAEYARRGERSDRQMPLRMLEKYRHKDLDGLLNTMDRSAFSDVWPLLRQGLHSRIAVA